MTLDEAIAHAREKAKEQRSRIGTWDEEYSKKCEVWAEEYEQIAEWLEELKSYRQYIDLTEIPEQYKLGFQDGIIAGNNKAVDDFVKEICKMYVQSERNGNYKFYAVEIKQAIADLAEQLKAGVAND